MTTGKSQVALYEQRKNVEAYLAQLLGSAYQEASSNQFFLKASY